MLLPPVMDYEAYVSLALADPGGHYDHVMEGCRQDVVHALGGENNNTDITLINGVCDTVICLHKVILCSHSSLFSDILTSCEDSSMMVLTEVNSKTMHFFKDLLYNGNCEARTDKEKIDLIKLLFRLGFHNIARNLSLSTINTREQKIPDLNSNSLQDLQSLNHESQDSDIILEEPDEKDVDDDDAQAERETDANESTIVKPTGELRCKNCKKNVDHECQCSETSKKMVQTPGSSNFTTSVITKSTDKVKDQVKSTKSSIKAASTSSSESTKPSAAVCPDPDILEDDDNLVVYSHSKACPVCNVDIPYHGQGWKYPLFSHIARKHFSDQIIRDYCQGPKPVSCHLCGKKEDSFAWASKRGQFIAHLGARHRLIEKYLDLETLPQEMRDALMVKDVKVDMTDCVEEKKTPVKTKTPPVPLKHKLVVAPGGNKKKTFMTITDHKDKVKKVADRRNKVKEVDTLFSAKLKDKVKKVEKQSVKVVKEEKSKKAAKIKEKEEEKRRRSAPRKFTGESDDSDDDIDQKIKNDLYKIMDGDISSAKKKKKKNGTKVKCPHCDKHFADLRILYSHQLSKHFR